MCILLFEVICCLYEIPAGVLRGIGYPILPTIATIAGTCVVRIVWIYTIFRRYHSLKTLYIVFPISWVLTILLIGCSFLAIRCRGILPYKWYEPILYLLFILTVTGQFFFKKCFFAFDPLCNYKWIGKKNYKRINGAQYKRH